MNIQVNATRMELLKLKKRLALAKRGHKLLKDKLDELIRRFMELVRGYRKLREEVEAALAQAQQGFLVARSLMSPAALEETLLVSAEGMSLTVREGSIMNTVVPKFSLEQKGDIYSYGFAETTADLDQAYKLFAQTLPLMIELAEREKTINILAREIERTRRRVNALEYVLIPTLEATIRRIGMRLNEMERANLTRLMRIKDIVRER